MANMLKLSRLLASEGGESRFWATLWEQLKSQPMRRWTWDTWDAFFELAEMRGVMVGSMVDAELVSIGGMFTRSIYRLWAFMAEHRNGGRSASEVMAEWDARVDAARRSGMDSHDSHERAARAARIKANAAGTPAQRKPVDGGAL